MGSSGARGRAGLGRPAAPGLCFYISFLKAHSDPLFGRARLGDVEPLEPARTLSNQPSAQCAGSADATRGGAWVPRAVSAGGGRAPLRDSLGEGHLPHPQGGGCLFL